MRPETKNGSVPRAVAVGMVLASNLMLSVVAERAAAAKCTAACSACCELGEATSNPDDVTDAPAIMDCIDNVTFTAGKHSRPDRARIIGRPGLRESWDSDDGNVLELKLSGFSRLYFGVSAVPIAAAEPLTHARLLCKAIWIDTEEAMDELNALKEQ